MKVKLIKLKIYMVLYIIFVGILVLSLLIGLFLGSLSTDSNLLIICLFSTIISAIVLRLIYCRTTDLEFEIKNELRERGN